MRLEQFAFSVVIGLLMHAIFRKDEEQRTEETLAAMGSMNLDGRPLWKTTIYFAFMIGILVFANWGKPDINTGVWYTIYSTKWIITGDTVSRFCLGNGNVVLRPIVEDGYQRRCGCNYRIDVS